MPQAVKPKNRINIKCWNWKRSIFHLNKNHVFNIKTFDFRITMQCNDSKISNAFPSTCVSFDTKSSWRTDRLQRNVVVYLSINYHYWFNTRTKLTKSVSWIFFLTRVSSFQLCHFVGRVIYGILCFMAYHSQTVILWTLFPIFDLYIHISICLSRIEYSIWKPQVNSS